MSEPIVVMQRYELKYLLTAEQTERFLAGLEGRMLLDQYGRTSIASLYYDTPDYRLIRASIEKPVFKEKLRMRSYGRVSSKGTVFLELKKKYKGIVYKRRIELPESEAAAYMNGQIPMPDDSQIGREIDWFCGFYAGIRPAVYLCYDRSPWYSVEDPNLRATFDKRIRFREEDLSLTAAPGGQHLLLPHQSLFEIKTADAIPLWLVEALEAGEVRQASFSKYGEAYTTILKERSGVLCA